MNGGDNNQIAIGVSTNNIGRECPGVKDSTIAIIGVDGGIYQSYTKVTSDPTNPFQKGDMVGCYVRRITVDNMSFNMCQFFKNGDKVGPLRCLEGNSIYPAVAIASKSAEVVTNLGRDEFTYNLGNTYCLFIYIYNMLKLISFSL